MASSIRARWFAWTPSRPFSQPSGGSSTRKKSESRQIGGRRLTPRWFPFCRKRFRLPQSPPRLRGRMRVVRVRALSSGRGRAIALLMVALVVGLLGAGAVTFAADTKGTDSADHLNGTDQADTISGGRDDDVIDGEGGDDVLNGGPDSDTVDGGPGNDKVYGADCNIGSVRPVCGNPGTDGLRGGGGGDILLAHPRVAATGADHPHHHPPHRP